MNELISVVPSDISFGKCHIHQITPRMNEDDIGLCVSLILGSAKPRQPTSSKVAKIRKTGIIER
jgi:hypothetical protein